MHFLFSGQVAHASLTFSGTVLAMFYINLALFKEFLVIGSKRFAWKIKEESEQP